MNVQQDKGKPGTTGEPVQMAANSHDSGFRGMRDGCTGDMAGGIGALPTGAKRFGEGSSADGSIGTHDAPW